MAFPDTLGPRTRPAFDAILELLDDDQWHTHQDLVDAATLVTDLNPKTIDELIRKGYRTQHYTRRKRGTVADAVYRRPPASDLKDGIR